MNVGGSLSIKLKSGSLSMNVPPKALRAAIPKKTSALPYTIPYYFIKIGFVTDSVTECKTSVTESVTKHVLI